MELWRTDYSQEARNYLDDNGALVADLFIAIESLINSDGIPDGGATQIVMGELLFETCDHQVIYQRLEPQRRIRILVLKPN